MAEGEVRLWHASEEPISVGKVRSRGWTGRSNRVLESTRLTQGRHRRD